MARFYKHIALTGLNTADGTFSYKHIALIGLNTSRNLKTENHLLKSKNYESNACDVQPESVESRL